MTVVGSQIKCMWWTFSTAAAVCVYTNQNLKWLSFWYLELVDSLFLPSWETQLHGFSTLLLADCAKFWEPDVQMFSQNEIIINILANAGSSNQSHSLGNAGPVWHPNFRHKNIVIDIFTGVFYLFHSVFSPRLAGSDGNSTVPINLKHEIQLGKLCSSARSFVFRK